MTIFKQTVAKLKLIVLMLLIFSLIMAILNIFLVVELKSVPREMTIYVPPVIPSNGIKLKARKISNARIYAFTYYIWTQIQTWNTDGAVDYKKELNQFSPYLTTKFQDILKEEGRKKLAAGFLSNHQQRTFGIDGSAFNTNDVKYIGNGTWLVHLTMRTINSVNPASMGQGFAQSHVVLDAVTSFVFKVTVYQYAAGKNKFGLAISGYALPPKEIKVYQ